MPINRRNPRLIRNDETNGNNNRNNVPEDIMEAHPVLFFLFTSAFCYIFGFRNFAHQEYKIGYLDLTPIGITLKYLTDLDTYMRVHLQLIFGKMARKYLSTYFDKNFINDKMEYIDFCIEDLKDNMWCYWEEYSNDFDICNCFGLFLGLIMTKIIYHCLKFD